jgi:hypothetical protein
MGQKKNWSPAEELELATAWKITSKDPIRGTDQQAATFWDSVSKNMRDRDASACSTKWCRMQKIVQKFSSCYNTVTSLDVSGADEGILIDRAMALFKEKEKSDFTFLLVWRELKSEPKFKSGKELQDGKGKSDENDEADETPGRKAAKRMRELEKLRQEEGETNKRVAMSLEEKNSLLKKKNALLEQRNKINFFSNPNCPPHLVKRFFEEQAALYLGDEQVNEIEELEVLE